MRRETYVQYVDVAKVFGMFLIVYGHMLRGGELTKWIYSFHVPLFFFLMGITFHYEDIDFISFLKKKAAALLLPFFSWSLISTMLFELASSFIHLESSLQSSGVNPFINIALGYCDFNSPLWFLPCFFITEIILWIVQKIQAHIGNKFLIYCVIGSFALCLMWPYMNETEIFWNAHTAVILLPFAVLGRISSIWLNDCNVSIKTIGVATFLLGTGGWPEYI